MVYGRPENLQRQARLSQNRRRRGTPRTSLCNLNVYQVRQRRDTRCCRKRMRQHYTNGVAAMFTLFDRGTFWVPVCPHLSIVRTCLDLIVYTYIHIYIYIYICIYIYIYIYIFLFSYAMAAMQRVRSS